jgi:hypothetical protein
VAAIEIRSLDVKSTRSSPFLREIRADRDNRYNRQSYLEGYFARTLIIRTGV